MFKRIAVLLVVAFVVAGCAGGGFGTRTQLTNDVESGCIESRAAFNGHRLFCQTERASQACTKVKADQAFAVQTQAHAFCTSGPPSTPKNIETIQNLVALQKSIGRR